MRYGIPEYRLPRDVLDAEVARLLDLGVRIVNDHTSRTCWPSRSRAASMRCSWRSAHTCPSGSTSRNRDASKIVDAVSFLRDVASGERPMIGRKVAVYGGGNTAMDAARVARRLGAEESIIVYRRTEDQMPAHAEEREGALSEGVKMNWLRTISSMEESDLTVEIMELDENGKARGTGRFEKLEADTVILALGQEADSNFLRRIPGMHFEHDVVRVDPRTLMTDVDGIFAGGDAVPVGADGDHRRRARQAGGHPDRRLARPPGGARSAPSTSSPASTSCTCGTSATHGAAPSPSWSPPSGSPTSTRSSAASVTSRLTWRPHDACRAATASSATAVSARAPRTR